MSEPDATAPEPFWTVEITLTNEADYRRVYDGVEAMLSRMGKIGHLAGQAWTGLIIGKSDEQD
jgi:hypothetical protein